MRGREVGSATDRRSGGNDAQLSLGRAECHLGAGFHEGIRKRLGHSRHVGHHRRRSARSKRTASCSIPTLKDADGIPAPKIIYRMSENSHRLLGVSSAKAKESLEAAGAYETVVAPLIRETGWHLLGTAKMGIDPATSVVDAWGRSHDIPNLFIFDGSIWPTSSGMNPTATIAAMSLWCAGPFSSRAIEPASARHELYCRRAETTCRAGGCADSGGGGSFVGERGGCSGKRTRSVFGDVPGNGGRVKAGSVEGAEEAARVELLRNCGQMTPAIFGILAEFAAGAIS